MRSLKAILREGIGLFVDDGSFALTMLFWLAIVGGLLRLDLASQWRGAILFVGLALILIESATRRARRR